jgi:hypothetical protein
VAAAVLAVVVLGAVVPELAALGAVGELAPRSAPRPAVLAVSAAEELPALGAVLAVVLGAVAGELAPCSATSVAVAEELPALGAVLAALGGVELGAGMAVVQLPAIGGPGRAARSKCATRPETPELRGRVSMSPAEGVNSTRS